MTATVVSLNLQQPGKAKGMAGTVAMPPTKPSTFVNTGQALAVEHFCRAAE